MFGLYLMTLVEAGLLYMFVPVHFVCVTHYLIYAEGSVCSAQTGLRCVCVCTLGLSINMPYISPLRLSPCGSHTYIIHTLKHTLSLTGSQGKLC